MNIIPRHNSWLEEAANIRVAKCSAKGRCSVVHMEWNGPIINAISYEFPLYYIRLVWRRAAQQGTARHSNAKHGKARDYIYTLAASSSQEFCFGIIFTFPRISSNNNEAIVLANEPNSFVYISYIIRQWKRFHFVSRTFPN